MQEMPRRLPRPKSYVSSCSPQICERPWRQVLGARKVSRPRAISAAVSCSSTGDAAGLLQLDDAVDLMAQADLADGEHHLRRQHLVALDAAFGDRGADGLLYFLLRGDAHHLQEFAQRHVEGFFVHRGLRARGIVGPEHRPAGMALKAPYPVAKTNGL